MSNTNFKYTQIVIDLLQKLDEFEKDNIEKTVALMVDAIESKHSLFIFGAAHAGMLSEEAFYRAGGLVVFNPIFARNLMTDTSPISMTSAMERLDGYGKVIVEKSAISKGDVVFVHSVSGRNPVGIEVALEAQKRGAKVVAITSVAYSSSVTSRSKTNKRLFEVADVVIDNHGVVGDAAISFETHGIASGSTSTVVGATIINILTTEVIKRLVEKGVEYPPVFLSANIDGNDEKNKKVKEIYNDQIHYEF